MIPPRYGTRRRLERPTTGPLVAAQAARVGYDLMPHQRTIADVAGELIPDPETGLPIHAYSTVIVSLPRRAGKSLLILAVLLERIRRTSGARAWYTAQSRSDAAITFRDEWLPAIRGSDLAADVTIREANGSEGIMLRRPGPDSRIRLFPPTRDGLHGQSSDVVVFDEAWSHSLERGRVLDLAARPTMATRPGAQQWITSAAGDVESGWWNDSLDMGRTAAAADLGTGVCHLEWSADAPDLDLDDPAVWGESHPAVRTETNPSGTIPLSWLADEYGRDPVEFRRVYLNVTDQQTSTTSPIDPGDWQAIAATSLPDRDRPTTIGIDCGPDQSTTSLVACIDGHVLEVVDRRPGWTWVPDRLLELLDRYPAIEFAALDVTSPANALAGPLRAAGIPLRELTLRDTAAASAQFVGAVSARAVSHVDHPALTSAVSSARRRSIGDGAWTWGRRSSEEDISALVAAGIARSVHPAVSGQIGAIA